MARINRAERSRTLGLNERNGANATLRLFGCFLRKVSALLVYKDRVQYDHNKIKHPIRSRRRYRMLRQSVVPTGLIHASNNCIQNLYSEENK